MNIASLIKIKTNPKIPDITPGDTVRVMTKVIEGGKERLQPFQGVVIKLQRGGIGANFTVRRIAYGVGVERTFPFYSPRVEKVEVIRHGKVRRAKLYYLRGRSGKAARIKERRVDKEKELVQAAIEPEPVSAEEELIGEEPKTVQTDELAQEELEPVSAQDELAQKEPEAAPTQDELVQEAPEITPAQEEPAPEEPEPVQAQGELAQEEPEEAPPEEKPENKPE
jgi:large subunit ribosomal protein L19